MRQSLVPAWLVSLLLHVGIVLLLVYVNFGPKLPPPVSGVPVTLVSNGPPTSVQPEPTPAAEETAPPPAPEPTPAPPTPVPPAPPKATPKPQPQPKPPAPAPSKEGKTKPVTQKPAPSAPSTDIFKDAQKVFGSHAPNSPRKLPPGPPAGPPKPGPPSSPPGVALRGLINKVESRWNLDCSSLDSRNADVTVSFTVTADGKVYGATLVDAPGTKYLSAAAAAPRAVVAGQPYSPSEVPPEYRNQKITLIFHGRDACAKR